ncbi:MAG: choice-of-anchor J domain-containing protein [Bacteroidetes bacterium]|uniref:Choice-of-anchor J domain-containing protein n=1 Tax=Candidatus Cryptobacteroides merdavium TaxID=2840769 RepID=A0A9D9H979_9BACT|nr:choice-of-anchor J domain-containing protein [Candidatus Cryptobacteroides merdavium]
MKYKNLFALAAASLTMVFACQETEDFGPEEISINPAETTYEFPEEGGDYTVELTATIDWTLQGYTEDVQSWLSVNPSSGKASASPQTITIKAIANDGANRSADLVFYGNIMRQAALTITQPGPEGDAENITIAEFIEKADTENEYVLTGVVGDIATSEKYWGFSLKDETGTISCPFIGADAEEFKAMDIHTGDKVSIKGVYEFYSSKSEHQLSDGTVESHEPLDLESIQTVTVQQFLEAKDMFTMYRMTGTVTGSINANFASFDLEDETGTVYVYTVNNASEYGQKLKSGDKVTIRGAYTEYNGKDEVVDCTIESHEQGQGGGETGTPEGSGTVEDPFNVAGAYKYIDDNQFYGDNSNPNVSPEVYVKGTISAIEEVSPSFGNATYMISDGDGTSELEVYRGYYLNGDKFTSSDQIKVGDEVVIVGQLTRFLETYEFTTGSKIYSLNGQGGGEEPGEDPDPVPGDWIYSNSFNKGIGDFTIDNKVMNDPLTWVWNHDASYQCMKASAYVNNTNYESESWLISPVIDLSGETSAYLTFEHATNYFSTSTLEDDATVWAKEDGVGEWTKVTGVTYPSSQGWTFVDAGDIDISAYAGKKMQFAFVYKSSSSKAGTWEVKNVVVKNEAEEVVPPTPTPEGTIVLSFPDDNSANNNVGAYDKSWTAKSGNSSFTIFAFNNNNWNNEWSYIKCGRKGYESVATISNDTAMPELTSIEVTVDDILDVSKVNSVTLSIYSDSVQQSLVAEGIEAKNGIAEGIMVFEIPAQYQNTDQYYELTFDCASHTKNGIIQISKVTYIAAE